MHSDPDPRLRPELEQALRRGDLSRDDVRRLAAMHRAGPEAASNRRLLRAERLWFWPFVVLLVVGIFLGLPYYRDPHGHAVLAKALGLEAGAGALLIGRGALLLWRPSGVLARRSPAIVGTAMVVIGLGLLGLGLSAITNVHGFTVLAAPALVMIIGWIVVQIVRPRRSTMLAEVRRMRGIATAVLVYVALWPIAGSLIAALVAAIGTVS